MTELTCSGEESVDAEESNVVEETFGVKAETENGLCTVCQFITKPSSLSFTSSRTAFPSLVISYNGQKSVAIQAQYVDQILSLAGLKLERETRQARR